MRLQHILVPLDFCADSERVVRLAPCPVLVTRRSEEGR